MENIMSLNAKISKEVNNDNDDAKENKETMRIAKNLKSEKRRAEIGCVIRVDPKNMLSREKSKKIESKYLYGVTGKVKDTFEKTENRAFEIQSAHTDSSMVDITLASSPPVHENIFEVLKFRDDDANEKNDEINKYVVKSKGEWLIIDN